MRAEAGAAHDVGDQWFPGFERVGVNSSGRRWQVCQGQLGEESIVAAVDYLIR
jgi:hypothetical protein